MRAAAALLASFFLISISLAQAPKKAAPASKSSAKPPAATQKDANALVERVGNTGFIQLTAPSFKQLTPKQQKLAYWLTQASIAIDPIIYDQLSAYGIRQKRLLEEIMAHSNGIDPAALKKISDFAKLFWANRGNHNENTSQKFLPDFTFEELQAAAQQAQKNGGFKTAYADLPPLADADALNKELDDLKASLFEASFQPMSTAKVPPAGQDIITASGTTFYEGVTLDELKDFKGDHPLNSRVVKKDGQLVEEVYRAGTPDGSIAPGLYAVYLKKANDCLANAAKFADTQQAQVINDLIRYYQTGDFNDWLKFGADWVQNNADVDFANGFIEIYRDAHGAKGSSQSFVTVTDKPVTTAMKKLAQNAEYFEQKAPWLDQYKKKDFKPPVVKAVETIIETGDFHVNTVGDNLPNENEIHEKYGTKNFLFTGSSRALNSAGGYAALEEFGASPEAIARGKKYGIEAGDLLTAMHEVIGHGSGKLSDKMKNGAEAALKEYFSTLEEGRADLMGLWNVWDPKLKELGLISNQEEVAKAMYDSAALAPLTQLRRIPHGNSIEEDHQRDRQMIVNYIIDKTGGIERFEKDGKHYIRVSDYQKMRKGVGMLLAELMRIKAEGDYEAIKELVDTYGTHFDTSVRDEVVARFKTLNLPTYFAGINGIVKLKGAGATIEYPRDAVKQYLYYGAMYDSGLAAGASHHAAKPAPGAKTKAATKKTP